MAGRFLFVVSFAVCSVLIEGQSTPPATPLTTPLTPDVCIPTFSPEALALPAICITESFPVGDSVWFAGGIFVNPNAPPCTPPTTTSPTTPVTTPSVTTPPSTTPTTTAPTTTTPTAPPVTSPPVTSPPVTTPPATCPPSTTPTTTTPTTTTPTTTTPTAPPVTSPPVTTPPVTAPPVTTPTTTAPTTTAPVTTPPITTPPVTTPPVTTPTGPPANTDNKCSFLSYNPECKGMRLLISRNEPGSICLKEATFNEKLKTVALFKTTLIADTSKAIYKQSFGYYGTLGEDCKLNIASNTSPEFKQTQSAELVVIGVGKKKEWAVVTTSNKSVVLVIYNTEFVADDKAIEPFKAEIDALITQLQFKPEDVKPVPFEITIKLDHFIAPVGESAPTAGAPPS